MIAVPEIRFSRDGGDFKLQTSVLLPYKREDVFPFFADARNLQELTPPWLHFRILDAEPERMYSGKLIDYRIRLRGIPLKWTTKITVWDPPNKFVDSQLKGPYLKWEHHHTFINNGEQTEMVDEVFYRPPFGVIADRLIVQQDLRRIFSYRAEQLLKRFGR